MALRGGVLSAAGVALLAVACGGEETDGADGVRPPCPQFEGGTCLGDLDAGTYTTQSFDPELTYTVPDGWSNTDDTPGLFLLLPPGRDLGGTDAGTADYLGIYHSAAVAASDCSPTAEAGVGLRPREVVEALATREGLETSTPRQVEVGGLTGLAIDVEAPSPVTAGCAVEGFGQVVPLIVGVGDAKFGRGQAADMVTRLYVLADGQENVVIEVSDVDADSAQFDAESVIDSLRFTPR